MNRPIKLTENTYNERTSYKVGKINPKGEGLMLGEEITFTFNDRFDPWITKKGHVFKSGKEAQFDNLKVVGVVENIDDFSNVEPNDYGSVTLELPASLIKNIEGRDVKGTTCKIYMEEYQGKDYKDEKPVLNEDGSNKMVTRLGFKISFDEEENVQEVSGEDLQYNPESVAAVKEALDKGELSNNDVIDIKLTNGDSVPAKVGDIISVSIAGRSF